MIDRREVILIKDLTVNNAVFPMLARNQVKEEIMKSTARTIFVAFFVMPLLVLGGLGNPAEAKRQVLRIGTGVDVVTLDPHKYKSTVDLLVDDLIFENLVEFDRNLKVVPLLATSWESVDDTTWRFKLRKGVKFHDGTPFNAQAAKINLERMKDAPRGKTYFGMIKSATVEDEYTILVKTKTPFAPFLKNLCNPVGGMISPKAIEEYGDELPRHPVGTGRFRFKEWIPRDRLVLVRNDDYWGKKAKLDEFVLRPIPEEGTRAMAFESGEIDVISDPLPHRIAKYKANKDINVITGPATRVVWIGFNTGDKVLSNVKLRRAIAHAINRDEIVEHVVEGLAINAQAVIPEIVFESKGTYNFDYDPEKSKKLLKEAGYPEGVELNFVTCEGRYLKDRQIAEAAQAELAQVGIKTKVRVMEWGAYLDHLFRHEQQLFIIGWGFSTGDMDGMLRGCFFSTNRFNFSDYKNPKMDELLDRGISIFDPKKRAGVYEEIQQLLIDDVVMIPIYHKLGIYASSKRVKKFYPTPLEQIDISKTTIK